jgi:hypothetical protein
MTAHPYDALPLADGGQLIFTPCPGTKGVGALPLVRRLRPRALTLPAHTDYLADRDGRHPKQEKSQ